MSLTFVQFKYFLISLWLPFWPVNYFDVYCLISVCWEIFFQISFCCWFFCLILLWSENILCTITFLLNMLWFILWPRIWSFLVTVPCVSAFVEWSILWRPIRSRCLVMFFLSHFFCITLPSSVCLFYPFLRGECWSVQV